MISEIMKQKIQNMINIDIERITILKKQYEDKKGGKLLNPYNEKEIKEYEKLYDLNLPNELRNYLVTISREIDLFIVKLEQPILGISINYEGKEEFNYCLQISQNKFLCINGAHNGKKCYLSSDLLERYYKNEDVKVQYFNVIIEDMFNMKDLLN